MTVIHTPDQRLRVFISGVPDELEAEIAAARRAVDRLRLTALTIDTPAEAMAARRIWQSYVEQSHVFIGIYGQHYGPPIDESGRSQQDEECRLAARIPRLLYVRGRGAPRDAGLAAMLARVATEDVWAYRVFTDLEQLERLVLDDLAALLTERYESARIGAADSAATEPTGGTTQPPALPAAPTSLVGRAAERARLRELLRRTDVRMVTLTGPGGIGKTRLALAVAADVSNHFDGVRWADVSTLRDPTLLPAALVHALHLPEAAGRTPFETLVDGLREHASLLVIDSFERVAAAGRTLAELLAACPLLTMLVTSRSLVRVRGEHDFPVPPLALDARAGDVPDAIRLFVTRAQAADPSFAVNEDNIRDVEQICRRLDGLPLAIELAAARIRLLSPAALAARLDHRLELLTGGPRDLPERQRALRAALDWDYELLGQNERAVFRRLGVFANGTTVEAAEIICSGDDAPFDVAEVLGSLVDKSLVRRADAAAQVRLVMLETIREYAHERLVEADEEGPIQRRHAAYFLDLAEGCGSRLRGRDQVACLTHLETDHDNLRTAVRWAAENGDVETELRLCAALSPFWLMHGHLREGAERLDGALSRSVGTRSPVRAQVLIGAAIHSRAHHDFVPARTWLEEALDTYVELDDRPGIALVLRQLGNVAYEQDDLEHARLQWQHSLEAFTEIGDDLGVAQTLNNLALLDRADGRYDSALRMFVRCVDASTRVGDHVAHARATMNLANVVRDLGEPGVALALSRRAATEWLELGDPWNLTDCIEGAAATLVLAGDVDDAIRLYGSAAELRETLGARRADSERADYDAAVSRAKTVAGQDRFADAWSKGRRTSYGDAVHLIDDAAVRLAVPDDNVEPWLAARSAQVSGLNTEVFS